MDACDPGEKDDVGREGITTACPRDSLDARRENDRAKLAKVPRSFNFVSRIGRVGGGVGMVEGRMWNGMENDLIRRGLPAGDRIDEKRTNDMV